jgi:transmembrane sensor
MQLPDKDLEKLLEKYYSATTTPEEARLLEQWYEQLDISAGQQWQSKEQELNTGNEIYAGLAEKMAGIDQDESPTKAAIYRIGWRKISRIAAVLLITSGAVWVGQTIGRKQPMARQVEPSENSEQHSLAAIEKTPRELLVKSGYSNKKKVVLPDGSTAWLNVQSVLKYPDQFTGNKRVVTVEKGEVFFDIVHDAARPFTVSTGSVVTTVLGTSFLVKQTYEKDIIEVSVKTGKVRVEKFNQRGASAHVGRDLLPGDRLSFDTTANSYQLKQISTKGIAAFTEGKLTYDDASLEEIVYDISRKYHVSIKFSNQRLLQCRYRISFDDMALSDCLQLLGMLTNTQIEKLNTRHYIIKGESCN